MIGIYNYTVVLTYLSLLFAGTGIVVSLSGPGHPYLGVFFLLICGLCDAFDGKVARTKSDRSEFEQNFGIQIDSLSDIVAFGVLPACIGAAMIRTSPMLRELFGEFGGEWYCILGKISLFAILILYILAAMIRLAYFNVTEEERRKSESGGRIFYTGLPVTSASLIFPTILLLQYLMPGDITLLYFAFIILVGFAFLSKIQIHKPGLTGILIMVGIGAAEFICFIVFKHFIHLHIHG